ncbi:DEAD/DEAH box helicase [Brevibacterium jeotgali]|uniref:RNA helicase n=1 Tax=Brevibacterium jeotgali TaxID=1262550 RepID=A0A2H1L7T8_9MICO|nr:DEAD/DEAH box helicase [Brevibacterium jeotgali]TWC03283.1 superfamily II DNA/RNA helicase [Brevibacterium jeotgali]SMY12942.1 Superfamily II DNA and RNA helicase [Brevibacterium jeotgali]
MTDSQQTFADFGVSDPIVEALSDAGIDHPFPIQAMTLPVALSGADIIGQAKTGTGKTLGFGLPLLQRTKAPGEEGAPAPQGRAPQAIVVVPTRELATQVAGDLVVASRRRPGLEVVTIFGGKAFEPQIESLANGVDVVVGTPGRLLDLYGRRVLRLDSIRTAVFDEADEMLDLGFLPDVERIVAALPTTRQTMLFSATMPGAVIALARRYMSRPTHIRAHDPSDESQLNATTRQFAYRAHAMDKSEMVARILQAEGRGKTLIFARTKRTADRLGEELRDRGFDARALHGDLNQQMREKALAAFREGRISVLVATDVAARGIDIDDITHVINYQCPEDEKIYVHRVGRTGRAGRTGIAVTFVDWDDVPRWSLISRTLNLGFESPVETYSTSPHFFEDLDIPAGTKGRLTRRRPTAGEESTDSRRSEGRGGRSSERRSENGRDSSRRRSDGESSGGRSRRRTRGGQDAAAPAQSSEPASSPAADAGEGDGSSSNGTRRRRRRRRGGSGRSQQPTPVSTQD